MARAGGWRQEYRLFDLLSRVGRYRSFQRYRGLTGLPLRGKVWDAPLLLEYIRA